VKLNADVGVRFLKNPQRARKQFDCQRRCVGDVNFAAPAARHGFHRLHCFVRPLHYRAGFREKDPPDFGKPHGFGAVLKQCHAQFVFEVADLPAQRRLRNVKPRGRAGHVLFLGNGDEVSQVAQFHARLSISGGDGQERSKVFSWPSRLRIGSRWKLNSGNQETPPATHCCRTRSET